MSTPRVWNLVASHNAPARVQSGPNITTGLEVVELNPVLDLLESYFRNGHSTVGGIDVAGFLREHDRLFEEER
jgi:hypothetical protein